MKTKPIVFCCIIILFATVSHAGYWDPVGGIWQEFSSYVRLINVKNINQSGANITADNLIGNLQWTDLYNYPALCPTYSAITQLNDSVTCTDSWVNIDGDTMSGNLSMGNFWIKDIMSMIFNITPDEPPHQEGLLFWDDTHHTLAMFNDEPDVTLQIGGEMWRRVRNQEGQTILNGQLVYVIGATGHTPDVKLAIANDSTKAFILGMSTHDIEDNTFGYITTFGEVHGLDTSAFSAGDMVYLSANDLGNFTGTKTSYPDFNVHVGIVLTSHANQGIIFLTGSHIDYTDGVIINQLGVLIDLKVGGVTNLTGNLFTSAQHLTDVELERDLVLWMPFSVNTKDYSGFQNDGTNNGATYNATGGYNGFGAYEFDGDDAISIINSDSLSPSDEVSSFAWIKPNDVIGVDVILEKGVVEYNLYNLDDDLASNMVGACTVTNIIIANEWQHVGFSYNGTHNKLYFNGIEKKVCEIGYTAGVANLYIGARDNGASFGFNGSIDEVRIYNRSLTSEEIFRLFEQRQQEQSAEMEQLEITDRLDAESIHMADGKKFYQGSVDDVSREFDGSDIIWLAEVGTPNFNFTGFKNIEFRSATSNFAMTNTDATNADGGRATTIIFRGTQSGGEETTLAKIQASHDGQSDDQRGDLIFYTNSGSAGNNPAEAIRIDGQGNLGIGVTNIVQRLHVVKGSSAGSGISTSNSNSGTGAHSFIEARNFDETESAIRLLALGRSFTTAGALIQNYGLLQTGSDLQGMNLQTDTGPMGFYTDGTASGNLAMIIDTGQNVGIGTPDPTSRLHVIGSGNFTGNVTAQNVFLPQYIFPHTNVTLLVNGANQWTNITFDQEDTAIKQGIGHTATDVTNTTFTINADGIYYFSYDFDMIDTSASASIIDMAGRLIYINGTEIEGSLFETDITRVETETELSHDFLADLRKGDKVIFQFIADDEDVEISTHSTFGNHPDSASIIIDKRANLPS